MRSGRCGAEARTASRICSPPATGARWSSREHGLHSIAFPGISTGIYGYPIDDAARVAVTTLCQELAKGPPERVVLCAFSSQSAVALASALRSGAC
jgi:O-acetyl-ADP-ribose deacetylase (regulator of RNase III)